MNSKKQLNNLLLLATAVVALVIIYSCSGGGQKASKSDHVTLTTLKEIGEEISLEISANASDTAGVWVDLNNNKTLDEGESVTTFGSDDFKGKLGSQTFTVYGKVTKLNCRSKKITAIDVSNNPNLEVLFVGENRLTELNLSKNKALKELFCQNNSIPVLDLSNNTLLEKLNCNSNDMTSLIIKELPNLKRVEFKSNKLPEDVTISIMNALPQQTGNSGAVAIIAGSSVFEGNAKASESTIELGKSKGWKITIE